MATRRSLAALRRHLRPQILASPTPQTLTLAAPKPSLIPRSPLRSRLSLNPIPFFGGKYFSSKPTDPSDDENESEDDDDDVDEDDVDEDDVEEDDVDDGEVYGSRSVAQSGKSEEEMRNEAKEIGYEVIGRLDSSENPFKPYEPVFAVVQIGSHQFKVSNGDSIFTERLKYCDVNDKLTLNKVMMLGSRTQTVIGRPTLPDATVHAVVEEHALDAKVIIFKKKRRKNYRRTKGHRQELTKLRITDIQGVDKSEGAAVAA